MQMLYGSELNNFYLEQIREVYRKERERIASLKTKKEAQEYVKDIRAKVRSCFRFPETKCPLDPVITGKVSNEYCTMEKLYFFSRPGYPVTANFFLPKGYAKGKLPAVLFVCGHSENGKASDTYQTVCIGLVKKGFAVLSIDPMGQGERVSMDGKGFPEMAYGGCCCEHNEEGKQLVLSGEWFGAWRAYDGVRAVDYLLTRPEVDPKKIGLTGNSGGGTLTTWINAVEDRLTMAAPSCYITTWKNNVENELPADIEQMPPTASAKGLEMADFLLASAPRSLLIMGQKNDFFDHRGTIDTFKAVKHVYDLLGGNVEHFIGPVGHGYSQHNREAMYGFFTKKIFGKASSAEGDVKVFTDEKTWAAPKGDVRNLPGVRTIREMTSEYAEKAMAQKKTLSPAKLREEVSALLKIGKPFIPYYRVLRPRYAQISAEPEVFQPFSRFALETEKGRIMAILKRKAPSGFFHLQPELKKVLLYVPHLDSQEELKDRLFPEEYDAVYGLDVRGIGEMMASGGDQPLKRDFFHPYQADYHYATLGLMLDAPLLGGRVKDILCAAELLSGDGAEVEVEANRQGCIPALFAALLSDKITKIRLVDGLDSYRSIAKTPANWWPLAVMIPDVLRHFDLEDVRKALGKKLV